MPELPDLKVYSRNLNKRLQNKSVKDFKLYSPGQCNMDETIFKDHIYGSMFSESKQSGKEIFFYFTDEKYFSAHLMLTGKMFLVDNPDAINFKIASVQFDDGNHLVFADELGWAKINYAPAVDQIPDALDDVVDFTYIKSKMQRFKRRNLKAFLIDQKILKGIGNAYSDEIMWHSRISPESVCGKIPDEAIQQLVKSIKYVLNNAVESILEITPDRINGEERSFLSVHRRDLKQTHTGFQIHRKKVASKKTYYTDEQILYS